MKKEFFPTLVYIGYLASKFFRIMPGYFSIIAHGGVKSLYDGWKKSDEYTSRYAVEVKKNPDRDFVILNLADIQIEHDFVFGRRGRYTEKLVRALAKEVKPDLITLTGDNCSCDAAYVKWIKILDSLGVPWAPVEGNHDGYNGRPFNEGWIAWQYMHKAKNCLFRAGPAGMGYGNYIINITENGRVIHTLFMLDSHTDASDTEAGRVNYAPDGTHDSDNLWASQIEWYEWAVNGIKKTEGHTVESTVFMHIPIHQMKIIGDTMIAEDGHLKPEFESLGSGIIYEHVCAPYGDNGFFKKAKELGSTTMMVFGHDHVNNLCVNYEGIRLNYAQKTGHGSYWNDEINGGSVITADSDGHTVMKHIDYKAEGAVKKDSPEKNKKRSCKLTEKEDLQLFLWYNLVDEKKEYRGI